MKKKMKVWKVLAIIFISLFVLTLAGSILNHYYGWVEIVREALTPATHLLI